MNKDFVPYELAVKLKELGFDEPCFGFYIASQLFVTSDIVHNSSDIPVCKAPTFSQTFRFFREKYDWQHSIEPTKDQHRFELGYNYWIWNHITGEEHHTMPKNRPSSDWEYETYEEAELECLKKLIEIVKQKR